MVDRAIPTALADWMLPRDQWILKQFAFVMPAALFGALRFLCPDREAEDQRKEKLGLAISMSVGLVGGSLGFGEIAGREMSRRHSVPDKGSVRALMPWQNPSRSRQRSIKVSREPRPC